MTNEQKHLLPSHFYNAQLDGLSVEIRKIKRRIRLVSLFRLFSTVVAVTFFVFFSRTGNGFYLIPAIASTIAFLSLIKLFFNLKDVRRYKEELVKVNENELKALNGDYSEFESGKEFITPGHPFAFDLDIFGEGSIFQMLNRTSSHVGKHTLAEMLAQPSQDREAIAETQSALIELCKNSAWRQQFQAVGQLEKDTAEDRKTIEHWLNRNGRIYGKRAYSILAMALPIVTIPSWILYGFSLIAAFFPLTLSLTQLIITAIHVGYVNNRQAIIHKQINVLKKFHRLMGIIESKAFSSNKLAAIRSQNFLMGVKPSESFKKLIRYVDALDNRMNIIVGLILNSLLMWDINYMIKIEKWTSEFKSVFPKWVSAIAQFDALSSLSCFMYNHPEYSVPKINDSSKFLLLMKEGGHPLLAKENRVTNDLYQNEHLNLFLVTGANMAGKSTFLRTVGVNLILAMSGTCVCAKEFVFTPVQLYTSMRTNDSLQKQTSFFFAELKKLQVIVSELKKSKNLYLLLDEILKGTNSKDQHMGARRLIETIIRHNGMGIVATHDIELTNSVHTYPEQIKNIAFEIEMEEDQMIFNYTYKDGVCKNMNANLLMEQMSIFD